MTEIVIAPGVRLWPQYFEPSAQTQLVAQILTLAGEAPFYRPVMPVSSKPFSVLETNFGPLGWLSDESGYRYDVLHPGTRQPWPAIPRTLLELWTKLTCYPAEPECCLVNLYRAGARMGLHQDRDELALDAPVISVSLGDEAVFRIGGRTRRGATQSLRLKSGAVLMFGGESRLAFHGVDRVIEGTSRCIPGGGRLNLTLRRVNLPSPEHVLPR
jgi:alkylated DNA repair protein (DNA oxidative demethylase)